MIIANLHVCCWSDNIAFWSDLWPWGDGLLAYGLVKYRLRITRTTSHKCDGHLINPCTFGGIWNLEFGFWILELRVPICKVTNSIMRQHL